MLDTRPLHSAAFRHLTAAYCINEIGNLIGDVALAILVYDQTHSPLTTAALFLALRFAPALFAQLLTSQVVVIPPRRILPVLYLLEAVIFGGLAVIAHHFSLAAVLTLSAADGVLAITAKALTRSVGATHLLKTGLLRQGNAILNLGAMTAMAIGPAVGGLVVAWRGSGAALLLDAATFLVTAGIVVTTPDLQIETDREAGASGRVRAGIDAIRSNPMLVRLFLALALALILISIVIPIEVVFAKHTLHTGDSGYGLLLASWGVGTMIGGACFAASSRFRVMLVLGWSTALVAVGYGGLAASPDLLVACCFSVIGGIGNGVAGIAAITSIQEAIPLKAQSAVMAVFEGINQVMPALGFIIGGVLTALSSARAAYAVAAIGVAVVIAATAARPIRAVEAPPMAAEQ